jgi:hypothetical protein
MEVSIGVVWPSLVLKSFIHPFWLQVCCLNVSFIFFFF